MADRFGGEPITLDSTYNSAEVADYSSDDYTFTEVPRALNCSADGVLKVDMQGTGTDVAIYVVAGLNPYRATKIYNTGSASMTVVGLS